MKKQITLLALFLTLTTTVNAATTQYIGADVVATPGSPAPNADFAANAFDAAISGLGSIHTIDFESLTLGYSPVINLDANTTATYGGSIDPAYSGVVGTDAVDLGFNTTAGGANHLRFSPVFNWQNASLTLSFVQPVLAFGGFITGLEQAINGTVDVMFDDGLLQSYNLADLNRQFWGFTSSSSILSVTFNEVNGGGGTRDIWGIDDIVYVTASVPETSSIMMLGLGLAGLGFLRRKKNV